MENHLNLQSFNAKNWGWEVGNCNPGRAKQTRNPSERFKDVAAPPAGLAPLPGAACSNSSFYNGFENIWGFSKSFTVKGFKEVNRVNMFLRGIVSNWSCYSSFCQALVATSCDSAAPELKEDWEPGNNLAESLRNSSHLAEPTGKSAFSKLAPIAPKARQLVMQEELGWVLGITAGQTQNPIPWCQNQLVWDREEAAEHIRTRQTKRWGLKNSNYKHNPWESSRAVFTHQWFCRPRWFSIKNSKLASYASNFYFHIFKSVSMYLIFTYYSIIIPTIPWLGVG